MTTVEPGPAGSGASPTDRAGAAPGSSARRPGRDGRWTVTTLGAVVVASTSSVWQLTMRPFWIDEAISVGATRQLRQTIRGTGGTMALYYVLLDGWTALFGTSRTAVRSLSVVLVVAAVAAFVPVARRLLRGREARVAVLVLAALPALARMAQDARSYALLTLVTVACWGCLDRGLEAEADPDAAGGPSWPWFGALVPLAVAGVASQGLFALHLIALLASIVPLLVRRRPGALRTDPGEPTAPGGNTEPAALRPRRLALLMAPAAAAAAAATAGLLALGARDVGDWIPPLALDQARPFAATLLAPQTWVMVGLGALAVTGAVVAARRGRGAADPLVRWRALVPLWWTALPVVLLVGVSLVRPTLLGRYALPCVPGLALLVAVGAVRAWDAVAPAAWAGRSRRRPPSGPGPSPAVTVVRALVAVGLVAALVGTLAAGRVGRGRVGYEDWDAVVAHIAAQARPADGIVFPWASEGQAHRDTVRAPFEAAWLERDDRPGLAALAPDRPLGEVRRFDALPEPSALSRAMADHPRVWAVFFPAFRPSLRQVMALEPAHSLLRPVELDTFGGGILVMLIERR